MHEKRFECAGNASALSVGQKRLKADSKHMVAFWTTLCKADSNHQDKRRRREILLPKPMISLLWACFSSVLKGLWARTERNAGRSKEFREAIGVDSNQNTESISGASQDKVWMGFVLWIKNISKFQWKCCFCHLMIFLCRRPTARILQFFGRERAMRLIPKSIFHRSNTRFFGLLYLYYIIWSCYRRHDF